MRRRTFLQWLGLSPILATQDSKVWDEPPAVWKPRAQELEYLMSTDSISELPEKFNQIVDAVRKLQQSR